MNDCPQRMDTVLIAMQKKNNRCILLSALTLYFGDVLPMGQRQMWQRSRGVSYCSGNLATFQQDDYIDWLVMLWTSMESQLSYWLRSIWACPAWEPCLLPCNLILPGKLSWRLWTHRQCFPASALQNIVDIPFHFFLICSYLVPAAVSMSKWQLLQKVSPCNFLFTVQYYVYDRL